MASKRKINFTDETDELTRPSANKKQKKSFRYSDDMIDNLITCILDYKAKCEYANIDFDADKPVQYNTIREELAKLYDDDEDLFGPPSLTNLAGNASEEEKKLFKEKKKLISRGYQRILEKIKDVRQGFSKAILNGTRSGSGKIVYDHYDRLKQLWGGCPNTQPLSCGVDTSIVNTMVNSDNDNEEALNESGLVGELDGTFDNEKLDDTTTQSNTRAPESKQMKKSKDHAAILVDDKRKHLQRRLSASQRDALLLKEAKEDRNERKEFREMLKTANDSFVHALNNMSQSMLSIGDSIARTMDAIGGASSPQAAVPYYNINQVAQRFIPSQEQQGSSNEYFELQPGSSLFYQDRP